MLERQQQIILAVLNPNRALDRALTVPELRSHEKYVRLEP
jgi:hypothetical protein